MLLVGYLAQLIVNSSHAEINFHLSPDFIFFVLLPLLLYESATHINIHQFKLQFRTITFMATFGLLISIAVVGGMVAVGLGLPLGVGLLFGAMISATDPIAVLALFKTMGVPKRLALLIEGESMFNDATAVIAFRIIAAVVIEQSAFHGQHLLTSITTFSYVFFGSLVLGSLLGFITNQLLQTVRTDRIIETTITIVLTFVSFIGAEHYLHLSGVITTVAAGFMVGNFGHTKMADTVVSFLDKFWEYIGFLAVSLVFFFSTYNLNASALLSDPRQLIIVLTAVIIGRLVSVYITFFISNRAHFFAEEPDVPLAWQHVIQWGGLRGVIPLVLAFSVPESFVYRELLISFTVEVFLYSLIVHGLTIKRVIQKNHLDLPPRDEQIAQEESILLQLAKIRKKLQQLPTSHSLPPALVKSIEEIEKKQRRHQQRLLTLAKTGDFAVALQLQALALEQEALHLLYRKNLIDETAVRLFESELDLQQDALRHPTIKASRAVGVRGTLKTQVSFRHQLATWSIPTWAKHFPGLKRFVRSNQQRTINHRLSLLRARIMTSDYVLGYFAEVRPFFVANKPALQVLDEVIANHKKLSRQNQAEITSLEQSYYTATNTYYQDLANHIVNAIY